MKRALLTLASVGVMIFATPAVATPVDDFIARLNAWLEPTGARIEAVAATGKSKSANTRMVLTLVAPNGAVPLGREVAFSPIEHWDGDLLFAETIVISGFDHTANGTRGAADTITLSYVTLPPPGTENPYLLGQMLGGLSFDNLSITDDGESLVIDHLDYAIGVEPEYGSAAPTTISLAATVNGLLINDRVYDTFDLAQLPIGRDALIEQKADLYLPLHWSIAEGILTVSEATLTVPSLGTFGVGFQLGGLTLPLLEEISAFGMASATGGAVDAARQQAFGMKLLSGLTFNAASVSLTDMGVIRAALDVAMQTTAKTEDEFRAYIADFLDDSLGQFQVPDGRIEELIGGLDDFSRQGGTFGLDAFPEAPASLIELVALAQSPGALLDRIAFAPVHVPPTATEPAAQNNGPSEADFLDRLADYVASGGGRLDYELTASDDSPGVLMAFTLTPPSGSPMAFPSGGFVDTVEVLAGDVFRSSLSLGGLTRSEMGVTASVGSLIVQDMLLPPPGMTDPYLALQAPGTWSLKDISIDTGAGIVTAASVTFGLTAKPVASTDPESVSLSIRATDLVLPPSMADAAGDSPLLLLAGHSYDLSVLVDWSPETGDLSIYEASLSGDGLGNIKLLAFLGGLTPELFAEVWALQGKTAEQQAAASQAVGIRLLSAIGFKSAYLSLADAGMVDTALDLVALNTGSSPAEAKGLYVDLFRNGLTEAGAPALAEQVTIGLGAFFDDGGTLTINAGPAQPTSLLELVALASAPSILIDKLRLGVVHSQ